MAKFVHSVRKQSLSLEVASEQLAMQLQSRMGEINHQLLIPVIEQVLDELDIPGAYIRIPKLEINLGSLSWTELEKKAPQRLYREFRQALRQAIEKIQASSSPTAGLVSEKRAGLDLLEYYLVHGVLPYWAPDRHSFSFTSWFLQSVAQDPAGLVRIIRRHGHQAYFIERLALQLPWAALQELIGLLEPRHFGLIRDYLEEIKSIQRRQAMVEVKKQPIEQVLGNLSLQYLLRDPGTQFNRKTFLQSLVRGYAEQAGITYEDMLLLLYAGMQQERQHHPVTSSLPGVLGELLRDAGLSDPSHQPEHNRIKKDSKQPLFAAAFKVFEEYINDGREPKTNSQSMPPLTELLGFLLQRGRSDVYELLTHYQGSTKELGRRLALVWPPREVLRLFAVRQPEAFIQLAEGLLNAAPGLIDSRFHDLTALSRDVWAAIYYSLLQGRGQHASLQEWVAKALKNWCEFLPVSSKQVAAGVLKALHHQPHDVPRALLSSLEHLQGQTDQSPVSSRPQNANLARYQNIDELRYWLRYGVLPWTAYLHAPEDHLPQLISVLVGASRSLLRRIFDTHDGGLRRSWMRCAIQAMDDQQWTRLLVRLLPRAGECDQPLAKALDQYAAKLTDTSLFYAQVLDALVLNEPLDLEAHAVMDSAKPTVAVARSLADKTDELSLDELQSIIVQQAMDRASDRYDNDELWRTLADNEARQVWLFLQPLIRNQNIGRKLVNTMSVNTFESILESVYPGQSLILSAFLDMLDQLPSVCRPDSASMHFVLLQELIRWGRVKSLDEHFFERVLVAGLSRAMLGQAVVLLTKDDAFLASYKEVSSSVKTMMSTALQKAGEYLAMNTESNIGHVEAVSADAGDRIEDQTLTQAALAFLTRGEIRAEHGQWSKVLLEQRLLELIDDGHEQLISVVRRQISESRSRQRWAQMLGETLLARIAGLLEPRRLRLLLDAEEVLASAWLQVAPVALHEMAGRDRFWGFMLDFIARHPASARNIENFVMAYTAHCGSRHLALKPAPESHAQLGEQFLQSARHLARVGSHANLLSAFHRQGSALQRAWQSGKQGPATQSSSSSRQTSRLNQKSPTGLVRQSDKGSDGQMDGVAQEKGAIYIDNAGLVLAGAFLPRFFRSLDMLHKDEEGVVKLRDSDTAARAVHLLQYLVDQHCDAPEPALVLNKILCGLTTEAPIIASISPTAEELSTCDQMLKSMIANWTMISNTSISGLRETFFQREGCLVYKNDEWRLRVERKTLDVLVDQVPWNLSVIRHAWMFKPLYTAW